MASKADPPDAVRWRRGASLLALLACWGLLVATSIDEPRQGTGTIDDPYRDPDSWLEVDLDGNATVYLAHYPHDSAPWSAWFSVDTGYAYPLELSVADASFASNPLPQCSVPSIANLGGLTQCPFTSNAQGAVFARVQSLSPEPVRIVAHGGGSATIGTASQPRLIHAPTELPATLVVRESSPSYYRVHGLAPDVLHTLTLDGSDKEIRVWVWLAPYDLWLGPIYGGQTVCAVAGTGSLTCDATTAEGGEFFIEASLTAWPSHGIQQFIALDVVPAP